MAFYGRAELKQSDHRPVLAVLDVEARVVNPAKREDVVESLLERLGPSDGTVVSTPLTGAGSVVLSEDVIGAITGEFQNQRRPPYSGMGRLCSRLNSILQYLPPASMASHGEVRYSRPVRGTVWTQFRYLPPASCLLPPGFCLLAPATWLLPPGSCLT